MQDYKRLPQLPVGLDMQSNSLIPDAASGQNWVVVDGTEIRKRPGLRPVLNQLEPDSTGAGYTSMSTAGTLLAPRGVMAAVEYVVGNQLRQNSYDYFTPAPGSTATDELYIYNATQLVTIQDGRPVVIRRVPVLRLGSATVFYRVDVNPDTGQLRLYVANTAPGSESLKVTVPITSTTTLKSVADSVNASAVPCKLVDEEYTREFAFSCFPALADLPASCLIRTEGGNWFNLDATCNFIYAYVPFEMPFSYPYAGTTVWAFGATPAGAIPYRAFYTHDIAGRDGNVIGVQYQEEVLFAGRSDALMVFDGYRMSVAGCLTQANVNRTTVAATGALSAGVYNYLVRSKITRPSGQVTYGPPITSDYPDASTLQFTAVANDRAVLDFSDPAREIDVAGSTYSQVAASPRRQSPMRPNLASLDSSMQLAEYAERVRPQVGELLTTYRAANPTTTEIIRAVTAAAEGYSTTTDLGPLLHDYSDLGAVWEIYRTVAAGSTYYYVGEVPAGGIYEDTTSDATLVGNVPYVAKPYLIQRPPDCCAAVAVHQNRAVVVGEYLNDYQAFEVDVSDVTVNTTRPYIKNVYWTQPNNEEFSPTNNIVLDVTEGGELNSVCSTGDALYIGGSESMWVVQGNLASAASFTVNRIAGAGGTVGNTAVAALNGQVYAISRAGLYQLVGGAADYTVGKNINPLIRQVKPELLRFARVVALRNNAGLAVILPGMVFERPATQDASAAETFPNSYVATESAADTVTLVFDPNTQTWSRWTGTEMYMGGGLVEFDGLTWAFPRKEGKPICVLDSGYAKDGHNTAVEMRVEGPWQHEGDIFTDKNFARLRLFSVGASRQNFVLTTKIERNWVADVPVQTAEVGFRAGLGFGELPYGEHPWGDPNEMAQQVPISNQKSLSVRAVLENSDPAEFPSITGWNFEVGVNRQNMKQE